MEANDDLNTATTLTLGHVVEFVIILSLVVKGNGYEAWPMSTDPTKMLKGIKLCK